MRSASRLEEHGSHTSSGEEADRGGGNLGRLRGCRVSNSNTRVLLGSRCQLTKAAEEELDAVPLAVAELRALEAALEAEPAALEAELRALEAALEAEPAALEREPETELAALEAELPAPAKMVVAAEVVIVELSEVMVVRKVEVVMAEPAAPLPVAYCFKSTMTLSVDFRVRIKLTLPEGVLVTVGSMVPDETCRRQI